MNEPDSVGYRITSRDPVYWGTLVVLLLLEMLGIACFVGGVGPLVIFGGVTFLIFLVPTLAVVSGLFFRRCGSGFDLDTNRLRWWVVEWRQRRQAVRLDQIVTMEMDTPGEGDWYLRIVTADGRDLKVPTACLGNTGPEIEAFIREHAPHINLAIKP